MSFLKWLYPGIGFKRWIILLAFALLLISEGINLIAGIYLIDFLKSILFFILGTSQGVSLIFSLIGFLLISIGIYIVYYSIRGIIKRFGKKSHSVDHFYKQKILERGPKVVALGGGTGLSNLLRGLKIYTSNITAIVTVADDGGSSGRLRDEMGVLPPGDIRNCLVALADAEPLMKELFQYRFKQEGQLEGHSFGNLFIASLSEVLGDFEEAIKESSKVLNIRGKVLPATNDDVRLGAIYTDKTIRMGESVIPEEGKKIDNVFLKPEGSRPTAEAIKAIQEADIIVIGPGSLYTSVIPNLLVGDVSQAIKKSKAVKIYICNVMTQPGETTEYKTSDHIKAIYKHSTDGLFDYVVVNREEGSANLARRYEEEGAYPVKVDKDELEYKLGVKVVSEDLLSNEGYIRHDPHELARIIFRIAENR